MKLITKFSNKLKKRYSGAIFSQFSPFLGKSFCFFSKNRFCHAQHHMGLWHLAEFQKKLMSQSQENLWTEKRIDGLTLIHRTPPATAGGLIIISLQRILK